MTLAESLTKSPLVSDWLDFSQIGVVGIRTGKVEFGQGIQTALVQIVAEELSVPIESCVLLKTSTSCSPNESFTAGSLSVQDSGSALRLASATAHKYASGSDYWKFYSSNGWGIEVEVDIEIKNFDSYTIVGRDVPRLDLGKKVEGAASFIHDLRFDGLLYARVLRPPHRGAQLISLLDENLGTGVVKLIRNGAFVAVIANDEFSAITAIEKLAESAKWSPVVQPFNSDELASFLEAAPFQSEVIHETGSLALEEMGSHAVFTRPFISHASIGTVTAIAQWVGSTLTLWSQSQGIYPLRSEISRALGMSEVDIVITHIEGAGCYGHNGADDAAFDAALIAREVAGTPVLLSWSRADELSWAPFGPAMRAQLHAQLDDTGKITHWSHTVRGNGHSTRPSTLSTPSLLAYSHIKGGSTLQPAGDPPMVRGGGTGRNAIPLYGFENMKVTSERLLEMPIRTSAMRALGAHLNVFAIESFMDELALESNQDPIDFRLRHLSDPRARDVINKVAELSNWGQKLQDGCAQGIGFARYKNKGAWCAVVAQVEAEESLKVRHLWIAVDVGLVINPNGVINQIEGGALQSLSWTTKEEVKISNSRVESNDWEEYAILKFSEIPFVTTEIISRPDMPTLGSGEASIGPTGAAIANALAGAIGVRVRNMPLTSHNIIASMS